MHPQNISILDYTYELPEERIAKYPLPIRDESKLLVYDKGNITDSVYKDLTSHLPADALLVFNNTKVVEARLLFTKSTGGVIELFCLEPDDKYPDITTAMLQRGKVMWKCLVGGAKKWKGGALVKIIKSETKDITLSVTMLERLNDYFSIEFSWDDDTVSFAEILHKAGQIPLPPYLNRTVDEADKDTYQTIYAKHDGSVAAPTAGLHFTERLFESLATKGIGHRFVTLHVGAGTFKPVSAATMSEHEMHAEFIDVPLDFIEDLINHKTIIPVGTTSLRTLESLYWLGVKAGTREVNDYSELTINQWDAYNLPQYIPLKEAIESLTNWMKAHNSNRLITKTQLLIAPGYKLRVAKGLVTNFHQPQSTLLLLVAAIIGADWRNIYDYALTNNYRFLSYGDGCFLKYEG